MEGMIYNDVLKNKNEFTILFMALHLANSQHVNKYPNIVALIKRK